MCGFGNSTGLYYYRARYYSPKLGRFLQTDPIGTKDDLNLYAYVYNDPINRTDPSGLEPPGCGGGACVGPRDLGPVYPVDPDSRGNTVVTSPFGPRVDAPPGAGNPHNGTDFRNDKGGAVRAPQSGKVVAIENRERGGNTIVVENDDGTTTGLAHTKSVEGLKAGDHVNKGKQIGVSDGSGTQTAHTHITYKDQHGERKDPMTTQFKDKKDWCKKGEPGCP